MVYAAAVLLFIVQAVYMRLLFGSFRRKIYLDVMDFVIERSKKSLQDAEDDPPSKKSHLKLVSK